VSERTGITIENVVRKLWEIADTDARVLFNANGGLRNASEVH
jgi:hypothetical protein